MLRGKSISAYWPQTKILIWEVLHLTSSKDYSLKNMGPSLSLSKVYTIPLQIISRLKYGNFTTIVNKKQKQSETKLDSSLKNNGANYSSHQQNMKIVISHLQTMEKRMECTL